jgi:hypothetical protein
VLYQTGYVAFNDLPNFPVASQRSLVRDTYIMADNAFCGNADFDNAVATLRSLGCKPRQSGSETIAFCPIHESDGSGHNPSLTLRPGDKVPVLVKCHAGCDSKEILKALGVEPTPKPSKSKIVATYDYRDADGKLLFQKVRLEPKSFRIRHQIDGKDVWKKPNLESYPLYRSPEVKAAIAAQQYIYVVEGEKDADNTAKAD